MGGGGGLETTKDACQFIILIYETMYLNTLHLGSAIPPLIDYLLPAHQPFLLAKSFDGSAAIDPLIKDMPLRPTGVYLWPVQVF